MLRKGQEEKKLRERDSTRMPLKIEKSQRDSLTMVVGETVFTFTAAEKARWIMRLHATSLLKHTLNCILHFTGSEAACSISLVAYSLLSFLLFTAQCFGI